MDDIVFFLDNEFILGDVVDTARLKSSSTFNLFLFIFLISINGENAVSHK